MAQCLAQVMASQTLADNDNVEDKDELEFRYPLAEVEGDGGVGVGERECACPVMKGMEKPLVSNNDGGINMMAAKCGATDGIDGERDSDESRR